MINEPSKIWQVIELIEKIRFQALCGSGFIVYEEQLDRLEELIDEVYLENTENKS